MNLTDFSKRTRLSADLWLSYYAGDKAPGDALHQKDYQTLSNYQSLFEFWQRRPSDVLEIGVREGGSLLMWSQIWPEARLTGIDISIKDVNPAACALLAELGARMIEMRMPDKNVRQLGEYDLIIDDGAHGVVSVVDNLSLCYPAVRSGGLYVIEDWHLTQHDPDQICAMIWKKVVGHDDGSHFCDDPFPPESPVVAMIYRRLIALFKR